MMERETFLVLDKIRHVPGGEKEVVEFTVNVEDIISCEPRRKGEDGTLMSVMGMDPCWVEIVQTPQVIQQMLTEVGCMLCIRTE